MKKIFALALIFLLKSPVAKAQVHWVDWSDSAFAQAKKENKLVILDLQAIWCHWCHVMEETTYHDAKINSLLNTHFITIRVDQDSRPDISNRYEDYGWPATIIFNGDGKELAKRSGYIPPEKMTALLNQVIASPNTSLDDEEKTEDESKNVDYLSKDLEKDLAQLIESKYDSDLGSWDINHKFLDAGLVEYLLSEAKLHKRESKWLKQAKQTLDAQLKLIDPAWGGVYQYSAGGTWNEPHFEKIMSVQADNLRAYSLAYETFHDPRYLQAAKQIQGYLKTFLTSPEGAFYTSQDADLVQGEHAAQFFDLSDHDRRQKGIPHVDKNIYSRENGWAIQGVLALYGATGDAAYLTEAKTAALWILRHRQIKNTGGFSHGPYDSAGPFLNDTLSMGVAFMRLYMSTGDRAWLDNASRAAKFIGATFPRRQNANASISGFITAVSPSKILKPTLESDENVQLARFTNLLSYYTGEKDDLTLAKGAMNYVTAAKIARNIFIAPSLLLLQRELNRQPVHVTVVGHHDDAQALALVQAGLRYPATYKRLDWWDKREGALTNADVTYPELKKPAAFACANQSCGLPAGTPDEVLKQIERVSE